MKWEAGGGGRGVGRGGRPVRGADALVAREPLWADTQGRARRMAVVRHLATHFIFVTTFLFPLSVSLVSL